MEWRQEQQIRVGNCCSFVSDAEQKRCQTDKNLTGCKVRHCKIGEVTTFPHVEVEKYDPASQRMVGASGWKYWCAVVEWVAEWDNPC